MKVKVTIGIVFFILGVGLSLILESFLRNLVFDLYTETTNNGIQFVGKNLKLFASPIYYIFFVITFSMLALDSYSKTILKIITNITIAILIFTIILIGICAFDANLKIMECTACNNGIRKLKYNEVNYGLNLGLSAIFSAVPSLIRLLKQ